MKAFTKILLVAVSVLCLSFTFHKFYMSVTQVNYSEKDKALQITSRLFIDDIEKTLNTRYGINSKLATKNQLENIDTYISKYLKHCIVVKINNKVVDYTFLGKEYDNDVMKCYIEIPKINKKHLKSIEITNNVMFEMFTDQQNLVHIKIDDTKSFILTKYNNKAMLKF